MKRRYFMAGMGMGALTLAKVLSAAPAALGAEIDVPDIGGSGGRHRGAKHFSVAIVGVGDAGCNTLAAMRTEGVFEGYGQKTELIAVGTCPHTLEYVRATNRAKPKRAPIKTLAIAECGAGGSVNSARAAALRHSESLRTAVTGSDVVVLIAGIGRGTGSGVTPMLATMARTAGAITVVMAVTPFDFEVTPIQISDNAFKRLRRDADLVLCFSNQAVGDELGDSATLDDVYAIQLQRISTLMRKLRFGWISSQTELLIDEAAGSSAAVRRHLRQTNLG